MRSVSVIGIGETKMGSFPDKSLKDLILEAGNKAIEDAGIEKERIEALFLGNFNSSYWCNQSHMGPMAAETLGMQDIPTIRTEGACASGSLAFRQGLMAIASGMYDVVIIGGVEKMTHQSTPVVTAGLASAADYEYEVKMGATFPSLFAMIANRYFYEYGNVRKEMAMVAVQNHDNALLNPDAQMHKKITIDKVYGGFPVAYPLTVYDCSLVTDGAVFVVLSATEIAKEITDKRVVEIIGSGHGGDSLTLHGKTSMTSLNATLKAAKEAYDMAGVKPSDIDIAEVHDCFTITQIVNTEDLGFFEKGKGARAVAEGKTALDGEIPINTSGGLKAKGHPIGATGLSQIYEVVTQLRGEAGERQVKKDINIGLTHNLGGSAATCVVNIFKGW
ncbi:thiolase domain-containing protein [Caldisalinibacter kiritimatiensis]|uniref:Putative lipid-transfer protein n=1 Tax=Caldisalinibacter kiritimatiensis TaxID=1304284 RepID=R1AY33_9FIRM|nr:thiolase domain-containing protein [Caldisalinibacter kiritimatiensis]EOD01572.1 putative lipid-transfer protein [Caldisalinibacter kiritimatiensis]